VPGSPGHLTRRFFDVILARPLSPPERAEVKAWLSSDEAAAFFAQSDADQRHGHSAAATVRAEAPGDAEALRAALLHDIGKRHAGLGVIGRVVASVLILAKAPLRGRLAIYRDHGPVGADELQQLGAEALVVDFARHHHEERPASIEPATWDLLWRADHHPKPGTLHGSE
jgi:putative nucleotidyltransferase with HDIG domain